MANEKRLIDASPLLEEIERIYADHYEKSSYKFIHDFFNAIRRRIRRCPTVDAVEVVRCKDCKHFYRDDEFNRAWCGYDKCVANEVAVNGYCYRGERRTNE